MLQLIKELEQYDRFKREEQPLEMLHLKLRTLCRDLTAALKTAPEDQVLKERLARLQQELAELESRAPWIVREYPVELALWGPGAGLL
jgi:uncharacterized membrane protein